MELDRLVPNNIMSGGPEDLNLIELLWKQDVDLGVGKEVYDQTLREELERQQELEYYKQQEKLKAKDALREKEERSKQKEASRWLEQNFMRDGETGEWVKRQNKTKSNNGSAGLATANDTNDDFLTLEAALDYISYSVNPELVPIVEEVPVVDSLAQNFQGCAETNIHGVQTILPAEDIQQLSVDGLLSQGTLENEWSEVEEYLNISLSAPLPPTPTDDSSPGSLDFDVSPLDSKHTLDVTSALDSELPLIVEQGMFTSADLPLLQDAALPSSDIEPVPELGAVTLTNASVPPQPIAMNTSMDWELGNLTFFENLTALPIDNVDDIDLQNMEDLFNTMSETSELMNVSNTAGINNFMVDDLNDTEQASLPRTSFSEDLSDAFDDIEGATGGVSLSGQDSLDTPYSKISRLSESSSSDSGFSGKGGFSSSSSSSSSYYAGSPADSTMANSSTNSNDTEHDPHGSQVLAHQVAHNHTYNTLPGHVPREVKKYAPKENTRKGPQCRDARKAQEMKIPFTIDQIVESPVETFNDILTKYSLNEDQLTLIRDIRRRGKNKLAAQNCRKRKVGAIVTLSDDMVELQKVRDRLKAERTEMERETRRMKEKFGHLYTHIFQSLRDEHGEPYDTNRYSLQQSSDGNVFLVPRNVSTNGMSNGNSSNSDSGQKNDVNRIKKRRSDN